MPEQETSPLLPTLPPSSVEFLRTWLLLSVQSFGGGVATLALIRRAVVEQQGWLTEAEFTRDWALVQVAPGINLLAMTILIGRRVAGARGIVLALLGLLLPSILITVLLTATYAHIQNSPLVRAALRGVIPATVGLGLLTSAQIGLPLLRESQREGKGSFAVCLMILVGSGLVSLRGHYPVLLILLLGGAVGGLAGWWRHVTDTEASEEIQP